MKYLITLLIASFGILNISEPVKDEFTLTVTVEGVQNKGGTILVGLFDDSGEFPDGEMIDGAEYELRSGGSVEIVIENIPAGDYAVSVLHDANDNGDIDMNDQGMPLEGFGFSNNAMGEMGPPDFDAAAFSIDEDMEIEVTLLYMAGANDSSH